MKIKDLITESVTFNPVRLKKHDTREYWSSQDFESEEIRPCWVCDGTGKDKYHGHTCDYCHGKGTTKEYISNAPELNVSNSNAWAIQEMLGIKPDYSGVVEYEKLPDLMRKLIQLKNKDVTQYTQDPSKKQGKMGSWTDDQGQTHIGRQGATVYDFGRSHSQVESYIDRLIKLVKFAQENKAGIGWG